MRESLVIDSEIASEALAGLTARKKTLPSKLFYDAAGVRLFNQITELPEYYLTRTETALLKNVAPALTALAPKASALIEYGASDEAKGRMLLQAPGRPFSAYVPVDVAEGALHALQSRLTQLLPWLAVHPVNADFTTRFALPRSVQIYPKFGFFPGSTIGNFEPEMAHQFLTNARASLGLGAWLIVGVDLRKDPSLLLPAYNDAAGVTAHFNLNLLHRLNREAGADFRIENFAHEAIWNSDQSRIEMHLKCLKPQRVRIAGSEIDFAKNETIHTENSYKHSLQAFQSIAAVSGWNPQQHWIDPAGIFSIHALHNTPRD